MSMRFRILLPTWVILTAILVCDAQLRSSPPYYVYVINEASGDMSVINPLSNRVVRTVPLGKRPRGIHTSLDRRTIYLTLSGSPMAPPGVDETRLPPADKTADGIGVFDVGRGKVTGVLQSG